MQAMVARMDLTRREALAWPPCRAGPRRRGRADLEVPYVPTPPELVERMLDLAEVGPPII